MINEKSDIHDLKLFVYIETVLAFLIVLATIFRRDSFASICFYGTFIVLFVALIIQMSAPAQKNLFALMISIILLSAFNIAIGTLIQNGGLPMNAIKQYLIFLTIIIYAFICVHTTVDRKIVDFILKTNILFAILYAICNFFLDQKMRGEYITLNFTNPNLAAMWLLMTLLMLGLGVFILREKKWKVICAVLFAVDTYILTLTGSRNCLLALGAFIILVIYSSITKKKQYGKFWMAFFNILPSVFVVVYLTWIDAVGESGILDFTLTTGKDLSSRVAIWTGGFEKLGAYWPIGNFFQFHGNNMHNSHMVLLTSYGAGVLLLVVVYLYKICVNIGAIHKGKKNMYCMSAFFCALFVGFGEGSWFSGGMGLFIMICSLIVLFRFDYDGEEAERQIDERK